MGNPMIYGLMLVFFKLNMSTKVEFSNKYNFVVERGIMVGSQIHVACVTSNVYEHKLLL